MVYNFLSSVTTQKIYKIRSWWQNTTLGRHLRHSTDWLQLQMVNGELLRLPVFLRLIGLLGFFKQFTIQGLLFGCLLVYLPPLNIASMSDDTTYWCSVAALTIGES